MKQSHGGVQVLEYSCAAQIIIHLTWSSLRICDCTWARFNFVIVTEGLVRKTSSNNWQYWVESHLKRIILDKGTCYLREDYPYLGHITQVSLCDFKMKECSLCCFVDIVIRNPAGHVFGLLGGGTSSQEHLAVLLDLPPDSCRPPVVPTNRTGVGEDHY